MAVACALSFGACITVNIYFPAPEVRAAAEEIVEETWGAGGAPGAGESPGARLDVSGWSLAALQISVAHAEDGPRVNVSTAAIRKLKDLMKQHAAVLKPYLADGGLGVGNDGMLVVRDLDDVGLADRARVQRTVKAENGVRRDLYGEIATANGYGDDRVGDIQDIFAATWIAEADSGWWVQRDDGSWKRKP